jgi:hypothetical protein
MRLFQRSPNLWGENPGYFWEMDPMVFSNQKIIKDWIFGEFFESPESFGVSPKRCPHLALTF